MSTNTDNVTLAPPTPAPAAAPLPPPYTIINLGNQAYACTLDVSRLTVADPEFASVFLWLSSLSDKDTVRISFANSRGIQEYVLCLPLLNTIMLCGAKTIAVIDKMMLGLDCYHVMACKAVEVSEFSLFGIPTVLPADASRLSERDEAIVTSAHALLINARDNLHIITDADIANLENRQAVYIQPEELMARVKQG